MATAVVVREEDVRCGACGALLVRRCGNMFEVLSRHHGLYRITATGPCTIAGECRRCAEKGRTSPFMATLTPGA